MAMGSLETSNVNNAAILCSNAEDRNVQYPRCLDFKSHIFVYLREYLMAPFECRMYRPPERETHFTQDCGRNLKCTGKIMNSKLYGLYAGIIFELR